jgi:hypothetical protein
VGPGPQPVPHRGPPRRRGRADGRAARRHRTRGVDRLGLRVLDRELAPLARRGPIPHGLQQGRDPPAARRARGAGRAHSLGRTSSPPLAQRHRPARGRRAVHPRQRPAYAAVLCQLRRAGRTRRRHAGDRARRGRGHHQPGEDRRTYDRGAPGRTRPARRRPVHPHVRGAAHVELSAVAIGLRRVGLRRHPVAGLRPPPSVGGLSGLRPARSPLRRRRPDRRAAAAGTRGPRRSREAGTP